MNFDLTRDQELVQERARELAAREIAPVSAELDRTARWPAEIVARMGELGLLGVAIPVDLGGAGLDHVSVALVIEELSAACAGVGAIASVHGQLFCDALLRFGTPRQKAEVLAPAAAGKELGCFAFAEDPDGDGRALGTVAVKQADGSFVLDGSKRFVTLGPEAEHAIVIARSPDDDARRTAFLVRRSRGSSPGFGVSARDDRIGARAAHACTLSLAGVRVPAERVVGREGEGQAVASAALDTGRIGVAAQAIGIARGAFDEAAAYLTERKAAKVPGDSLQALEFMISDMAVDIDGARLLALRAARMRDAGAPHTAESSMAKLFASEMATRVAHRAMQILGARGCAAGGIERRWRDARVTEIDEGTSERQRSIIAGLSLHPHAPGAGAPVS